MANQIVVSAGAKVRNLSGVLTATSGVVSFLPIDVSLGIPQLDVNGKILVSQLPNSVMEYKGTWSAATNTPTLANGTGNQGDVYLCNVAGTVDFGAGPIAFFVGDQVIYSGSIWQRASGATGTVTSVAVTESGDSLNITGSPITTSGTINIGFNGTNLQYVNGAGNLTTFPTLTGYVPYTGATQDVDLDTFKLNAQSIHAKGTGGLGHFGMKHQSASATASANEVSLFADSLGDFSWLNGNLYLSKFITSGNTANRSYTFPNANGTVALTSDLSNYVDLTTAQTIGGTKTFTDATKNNGGIFLQNASSSSLAGYMNLGGLTNGVKFTSGGGVSNSFTLPSATGYTFTFPNATGTIALTSDISYPVTSVFGRTGAVVATSGDYTTTQVTEGTNLYFTDARARAAISLTTTGTSGAATYTSGVLNIPQYQGVLTNPVTGTGNTNYLPKFTGASTIGNSNITDTGGTIGISATSTATALSLSTGYNGAALSISGSANAVAATITKTGYATALTISNTTGTATFNSNAAGIEIYGTYSHSGANGLGQGILISVTNNTGVGTLTGGSFSATANTAGATATGLYTIASSTSGTAYAIYSGGGLNYFQGNVLIGATTNSGYKLDVTGTTRISGVLTLSSTISNGTYTYTLPSATGTLALTSAIPANPVGGTGTTNTLPKFTAASTIGNSNITDTGSLITLGSDTTISSGGLGIGSTSLTEYSLRIQKGISGSTIAYGISNEGAVATSVTSFAINYQSSAIAALSTTLTNYVHYNANVSSFASSTITNLFGFRVNSSNTAAINNYGFYGDIPSGTNRWNLYMGGTASNYMAGSLGIGTTSLTGINFYINKSITGSTNGGNLYSTGTIQSDMTGNVIMVYSAAAVAAASFTISNVWHYMADQLSIGAGAAITTQVGFRVNNTLVGAGTNYGFQGRIPSGTNRWNIYMDGTAANYMAGVLNIGTTTLSGYTLDVNGTGRFSAALSGTSATFTGGATFFNGGNTFVFSTNVLTSGNADGAQIRNVISTAANPTYAYSGDTDTGMYSDTANTLGFSTGGTNRLTIASTGAATFSSSVTATGFFESSDSRLKTLIQDNYQTKGIASITPKLYTKNGKVELGYYAQDLVGVLDSAVVKGEDEMLSLSYREVLVAKVYALEQRIKELENK